MQQDMAYIMLNEEQLETRVAEMGAEISRDYAGKNPIFVGILKGSFMFLSDLMKKVTIPSTMDFMAVSSYGNKSVTTGAVKINKDLSEDIENRHVIIVEDILDSGITLSYLMQYLSVRRPASIAIATLLDKPARRQKEVYPKYKGFEVQDEFVVGYGLDYAEKYRNLPYIGVLKPEIYANG